MPTRIKYPTGDAGGYPEIPVNVFAATCQDPNATTEQILDGLVDIVNRSPCTPQQWAEKLDIPFIEFVKVCHRDADTAMSPIFRQKVVAFFSKFPTDHKPDWKEVCG